MITMLTVSKHFYLLPESSLTEMFAAPSIALKGGQTDKYRSVLTYPGLMFTRMQLLNDKHIRFSL